MYLLLLLVLIVPWAWNTETPAKLAPVSDFIYKWERKAVDSLLNLWSNRNGAG